MAAEAREPMDALLNAPRTGHRPSALLSEIIDDAIGAVSDEIAATFDDPTSATSLRHGRYEGRIGGMDVWTFEADQAIPVPPETPARLKIRGEDPVDANVLAVNDLDLVVGTYDALGDDIVSARLSLEPTFILDALR